MVRPMRFEVDFLERNDAESIIADLRRVAKLLGTEKLRAKDLDRHGRAKYHAVRSQFGSLRKGLEAAGLKTTRFCKGTDEEVIKMLQDLWVLTLRDFGRRPRTLDVERYGLPIAAITIIKRFGSWKRALIAAAKADAGNGPGERPMPVRRRRPIGAHERFLVFKRDLYRCRMCGRSGVEIEVDHIVPVCKGGTDRLDNLQTLCRKCNRGKGGETE